MPAGAQTLQPGDLHVNQALTTVSTAYMQSADAFIADRVFPFVGSQSMSDIYWTWPRGTFFRTDVEARAPGTRAARTSFRPDMKAFNCTPYAIAHDIPDPVRANADSVFQLERSATEQVTQQMLLYRELKWASTFFKTGVWATDYTGVASGPSGNQVIQFNQSASDPITFFQTQVLAMQSRTGIRPNTLVLGPYVYMTLLNHPLVIDRIKYTQTATPMSADNALAAVLQVPRILIAQAVVNNADEVNDANPPAGATGMDFIYGKSALLTYAAPSPGTLTPTAGYTFGWTGLFGAQAYGTRIKTYREEPIASSTVECEAAWDMQVVASDLGLFVSGAVA